MEPCACGCGEVVKGTYRDAKGRTRFQGFVSSTHARFPPSEWNNRFWSLVEMSLFCWEWTGKKFKNGYGCFRIRGRHFMAHRRAYEMCVGPIPCGLDIDHLCRNRGCVNPSHLEPVTRRDNLLR